MVWPMVPLGEVAKQVKRSEVPQPGTSYRQIGVRLWGQGAYERGTIDGSETKYPVFYRIQKDDIIVNKIWARNGSVAVVTSDLDGSFGSSEFPTYEVDRTVLLPGWFAWFTKTPELWTQCDSLSRGTSGKNRLRPERFLEVRLLLPPLDEQQRVVAKLDKVAALVEEAMSLQTSVKNEWKTLLVNMAHRPDLSMAEKKECGWREVKLKETLTLAAEPYDVDPETSYPNLGIYSFARGAFAKPPIDGASTSAKTLYRVRKGQFIYSRLFAFEGAYTIVPAELDGRFVSNEFPSFDIAEDAATPEFLAAFFMNPRTWADLQAGSLGLGSRRQRVNQKHLLEYEIWLPPLMWQSRIGDVFGKFRACAEAEGKAIAAFMPAVLDGVFNGEVSASWMFPNYDKKQLSSMSGSGMKRFVSSMISPTSLGSCSILSSAKLTRSHCSSFK